MFVKNHASDNYACIHMLLWNFVMCHNVPFMTYYYMWLLNCWCYVVQILIKHIYLIGKYAFLYRTHSVENIFYWTKYSVQRHIMLCDMYCLCKIYVWQHIYVYRQHTYVTQFYITYIIYIVDIEQHMYDS